MTWRQVKDWFIWPPWYCHAVDRSEEGREQLEQLEGQTVEIKKLGKDLREQNRRNNFGPLVAEAIRRAPRPEGTS